MDDHLTTLAAEIERLKIQLAEARAALPAHSVRPWQLQRVEELEEELDVRIQEMEQLKNEV